MGLFNLFKPAKTVLVVDVVSLNESMGMKGNVSPRNQLQILRRLARFAQREKISIVGVLNGTPLNKAPAGENFETILVVYSKSLEEHPRCLCKTVRANGAGSILVTGNMDAEQLLGTTAKKIRMTTFRKVFDASSDSEVPERNVSPAGRSKRSPRKTRKKTSSESKPERLPKEMSETDAINELIDLVD